MAPTTNRLSPSQQARIIHDLAPLNCVVIYVFGSFGSPAAHAESDIDIAFLSLQPVDSVECFRLANTLSDRLDIPVDLIDLKQSSTVMAKEVLRTGTPIFIDNPSQHQNFEMRTLTDYARLNEERQPVLAV